MVLVTEGWRRTPPPPSWRLNPGCPAGCDARTLPAACRGARTGPRRSPLPDRRRPHPPLLRARSLTCVRPAAGFDSPRWYPCHRTTSPSNRHSGCTASAVTRAGRSRSNPAASTVSKRRTGAPRAGTTSPSTSTPTRSPHTTGRATGHPSRSGARGGSIPPTGRMPDDTSPGEPDVQTPLAHSHD